MHLKQPAVLSKPWFTYSAYGLFNKNKKWMKKFKESGDIIFIRMNQIKLVSSMVWLMLVIKIWLKESDKVLRDKGFNI